MFAAGIANQTYVYDFYTVNCPPNQICKGHSGKITSIDWFEDDSGFSDGCDQGQCSFYDLQEQRATNNRDKERDFFRKPTKIPCIANVPGNFRRAILSFVDRKLWDTAEPSSGCETRYEVS